MRQFKADEQQKRERCEHCGATLNVSGCVLCGAPVCCPQCCRLQSLADHIDVETEDQTNS